MNKHQIHISLTLTYILHHYCSKAIYPVCAYEPKQIYQYLSINQLQKNVLDPFKENHENKSF